MGYYFKKTSFNLQTLFKRRALTSLVTLCCFMFQTLLPSYVWAFDAWNARDYTTVDISTDSTHATVSILQKQGGVETTLFTERLLKTNLQSVQTIGDLFSGQSSLPDHLKALQFYMGSDADVFLTSKVDETVLGNILLKASGNVSFGHFKGENVQVDAKSLNVLGTAQVTLNDCFYSFRSEKGKFSTANNAQFSVSNFHVREVDLHFESDMKIANASFQNVTHKQGTFRTQKLTLQDGPFTNEGDVDVDDLVGENATIISGTSGDDFKAKRMHGTFKKVHNQKGSTFKVIEESLPENSLIIEELRNDGTLLMNHTCTITGQLINNNRAQFKTLQKGNSGTSHIENTGRLDIEEVKNYLFDQTSIISRGNLLHGVHGQGREENGSMIVDNGHPGLWTYGPYLKNIEKTEPFYISFHFTNNTGQPITIKAGTHNTGQFNLPDINVGMGHYQTCIDPKNYPADFFNDLEIWTVLNGHGNASISECTFSKTPMNHAQFDIKNHATGGIHVKKGSFFGSIDNAGTIDLKGKSHTKDITNHMGGRFIAGDQSCIEGKLSNSGSVLFHNNVNLWNGLDNHGTVISKWQKLFLSGDFINLGTSFNPEGGHVEIENFHWLDGEHQTLINHGELLLTTVHAPFSVENGGKVHVKGTSTFKKFLNHGNEHAQASALFDGVSSFEDVINAGTFVSKGKSVINGGFLNHGFAHARFEEMSKTHTFSDVALPPFIESIDGLSGHEPWGRWSDSDICREVYIKTKTPLPQNFKLNLKGVAYGDNASSTMAVIIGSKTYQISLSDEFDRSIDINLEGESCSQITFIPPNPQQPSNGDTRHLAVGFKNIDIHTQGNCTIAGQFDNHGQAQFTGDVRLFGAVHNHGVLISQNGPFFPHDPTFINHGKAEVESFHWINSDHFTLINHGELLLTTVHAPFSLENGGKVHVKGTSTFKKFLNHGNQHAQASALFDEISSFEEIVNAGNFRSKVNSIIAGQFDNHGQSQFTGDVRLFGAVHNHGVLISQNGPFFPHDPTFINHGKAEVESFHWINSDHFTLINHGELLLTTVHAPFSAENGGKVHVKGTSTFKKFLNHGNEHAQASALFDGVSSFEEIVNAGKFVAKSKMTLNGRLETHTYAEMDLVGFYWLKCFEYRLENYGRLFIQGMDNHHYPRSISNHITGTLKIQHTQGHFDQGVFNDRNNPHSGIFDGVEFNEVYNHGTFMLHHGYYSLNNLHNEGNVELGADGSDGSQFNFNQVTNPGRIESPRSLQLKHRGQDFGNLYVQGDLHLSFQAGLNGFDYLTDKLHAHQVFATADHFHNHTAKDLRGMSVVLHTNDYQNWSRLFFNRLTLHSGTFTHHNMAVLGTFGDMNIHVSGDVDNRWGRIHGKGGVKIHAGGKVMNGSAANEPELVYYEPLSNDDTWQLHKVYFIRYMIGAILEEMDKDWVEFSHEDWTNFSCFYDNFKDKLNLKINSHEDKKEKEIISYYKNYYSEHRLSGLLPQSKLYQKRKANGAGIVSDSYIHIDGHEILNRFGSIKAKGCHVNGEPSLLIRANGQILCESGFITAMGRARFESPKLHITMPPLAIKKIPNNPGADKFETEKNAAEEVESGPQSVISVLGDLELASPDITICGSQVAAIGAIRNIHGQELSQENSTYLKLIATLLHREGTVDHKRGGGFWGGSYAEHDKFSRVIGHIPATLRARGKVDLNFNHYQFDGLGEVSGSDVNAEGISLSVNGKDYGPVSASALQHMMHQLPDGVLYAVGRIIMMDNMEPTGLESDQPIAADDVTMANPGDAKSPIFNDIVNITNPQDAARLPQQFSAEQVFNGLLRGTAMGAMKLSVFQGQGVEEMLMPFLQQAKNLVTESGENVLSLMTMNSSANPLLVFMQCVEFVDGKNRRVLYPFVFVPNDCAETQSKKFKIKANEKGKSVRIQVLNDADLRKAEIITDEGFVYLDGKKIHLDQVDVTADKTIMFGQYQFVSLGSVFDANDIKILSTGPIILGASQEVYEHKIDSKTHKEYDYMSLALVTKLKAKKLHIETFGGSDIIFEGTKIDVPGANTTVKLGGGKVHFKCATNQFYSYRFDDDSDLMMNDVEVSEKKDTTFKMCEFTGDVAIQGASKIIMEKVEEAAKTSGTKGYYTNAMMAMMKEVGASHEHSFITDYMNHVSVEDQDLIEYTLAKEIHDYTHKHMTGPGGALMAVVAVITTVCTMGAGAAIAGAMMGLGGPLVGAAGIAASAAFSSLCVQTSMSLMQNGGDPFKATKEIANFKTLKGMALAAVTAYVSFGILDTCGMNPDDAKAAHEATKELGGSGANVANQTFDFGAEVGKLGTNVKEHLLRNAVSSGIQDLSGEKGAWKNYLSQTAASAIGQYGAGQIGEAYRGSDGINQVTHKVLHAALGAGTGSLMGGKGCTMSGALGALVAETCAEMVSVDTPVKAKEKELGRRLTPAEYENIQSAGFNHYMDQMQDAAKFGKIAAAVAAFLTQSNIEVAAATGANAIDHNFLMLAAYGVMVGSVGYSAYCVYTALEDGGPLAALQQLGIEIAVNAAGFAAGKFIIKSGAKILTFDCVQHAMEHVFKHTPGLQSALGHLTEKITSGINKLDQTALGQAASKLEAKLMQAEDKIFRRIFDPQTVKVRDVKWGKGIHEQGMPFEDYMGTKLPQGSRLPENFKTFDYFDQPTGRAVSVKTLDTGTVAKLENPQQIYGTLKRNIDAVINFEEGHLGKVDLYAHQIQSFELHLGIPHDILPTQRVHVDRAIDYAKLNGIKMEVFHVY